MRGDDITSAGEILERLKKSSNLGQQLEQARIWERWPEVAGSLAAHGMPRHIRKNVLTIEVDSPVWMHKYAYRKWDLIARINRMAGHELVHDVFLKLREE